MNDSIALQLIAEAVKAAEDDTKFNEGRAAYDHIAERLALLRKYEANEISIRG